MHIGRYGAARTQSFCALVIIQSRPCPLYTTSRGTCLTTYFGTSVRVHNGDWRCDTISPLSQRRTSYVLRRDSHGRRIGILSDAGQFCPGVCVCRPQRCRGPYQHITIAKAARKQYVFPFALAPLRLYLELIRQMIAELASGVILTA